MVNSTKWLHRRNGDKVTLVVQQWDAKHNLWLKEEVEGELDEMSDLEAYALVQSKQYSLPFRVINLEHKDEYRIYFDGRLEVDDW
jgi:hypothetical protein